MGCNCSTPSNLSLSCNKICTIEDAIAYTRRRLGEPIVCVEIANEQFVDIICDAIQIATRYLYGETVVKDYMPLKIKKGKSKYVIKTKEDGSEDTQWYEDHPEACWPEGKNGRYSPETWCEITDTIDFNLTTMLNGINILHSAENMLFFNEWVVNGNYPGSGRGGQSALVGYDAAMTFLKEVNNQFGPMFTPDFNELSHNLTLTPTPMHDCVGLLQVWRKEDMIFILNHPLVKQLIEGLARRQWSSNVGKFAVTLAGGGTINFNEMYQNGQAMVDAALERLRTEGEGPRFWVG